MHPLRSLGVAKNFPASNLLYICITKFSAGTDVLLSALVIQVSECGSPGQGNWKHITCAYYSCRNVGAHQHSDARLFRDPMGDTGSYAESVELPSDAEVTSAGNHLCFRGSCSSIVHRR